MATFTELSFNPDGQCSVCNGAGETLDTGCLQLCSDCIMVVAQTRAGTRVSERNQAKKSTRTRRNGKAAANEVATPPDISVTSETSTQTWSEGRSRGTSESISEQRSE